MEISFNPHHQMILAESANSLDIIMDSMEQVLLTSKKSKHTVVIETTESGTTDITVFDHTDTCIHQFTTGI